MAYAIADSPFGPFHRRGIILQQDAGVATSAGHHQWCVESGTNGTSFTTVARWEKRLQTAKATCIDLMYFDKKEEDKAGALHDFRGSESYPNP